MTARYLIFTTLWLILLVDILFAAGGARANGEERLLEQALADTPPISPASAGG